MEAASLWGTEGEGGRSARDEQLIEHLPLVHHVARQVLERRALDLDIEGLVSAGAVGLIEALEKFDPSRGLALSTFATPRIRGAILDELRRRDPLTRTSRKRHREVGKARERLAQQLGRAPSQAEVAEELGVPPERVSAWERDALGARPVALDRPVSGEEGDEVTPAEIIPDERLIPAEEVLEQRERVRILKEELLELPERSRLVVSLYYYEELKLHEIASIIGVSESRVSQIRSQALRMLRQRVADRYREEGQ